MRSVDSKSICPSFISFKNSQKKKTCDMNSSLINEYLPKVILPSEGSTTHQIFRKPKLDPSDFRVPESCLTQLVDL